MRDDAGGLDLLVNNAFLIPKELTAAQALLAGAALELGRHARRRHALGLRRERLRGAPDGRARQRADRQHQLVRGRRVRLARRLRRRQVCPRSPHGRHRARARAATASPSYRSGRASSAPSARPARGRRSPPSTSPAPSPSVSRAAPSPRSPRILSVWRAPGGRGSSRELADEYGFTDVDGGLPRGPARRPTTASPRPEDVRSEPAAAAPAIRPASAGAAAPATRRPGSAPVGSPSLVGDRARSGRSPL